MDRDVIGLCDQATTRVANRERKIAAGIEDLRIGGAKHGFAHLLHDRTETVLNNRTCNGIDFFCHSGLVADRSDHSKGVEFGTADGGPSAVPSSLAAGISAYETPMSATRCSRAAACRAGSWDQ